MSEFRTYCEALEFCKKYKLNPTPESVFSVAEALSRAYEDGAKSARIASVLDVAEHYPENESEQ